MHPLIDDMGDDVLNDTLAWYCLWPGNRPGFGGLIRSIGNNNPMVAGWSHAKLSEVVPGSAILLFFGYNRIRSGNDWQVYN
ncbi:MAG: hypothetical protein NPIRA05_06920 [Nitrospirales bacterium]|nr:MAG: hypothetical protein NPIRA05_06920 [Nitrospirales bacterium]